MQIKTLTNNKSNFLVCGDFNARVSDFPDYVVDDSSDHIHVLPEDYLTDVPLLRVSEDKGFNNYGSQLLDFCKQTGLRILNGRVGADSYVGKYTYVSSIGKSVVDYVIASQSLFSRINTFSVDEPNILSDHCIINFSLHSLEDVNYDQNETESGSFIPYKYIWDSNNLDAYQSVLGSASVREAISSLQSEVFSAEAMEDINSNLSSFQNVMESVCTPLFRKNILHRKDYVINETNQPWYNEECKEKRNRFYVCLDNYRSNKQDNECRVNMVKARSEYKKVLRQRRYEYKRDQSQILEKHRFDNAKNYWKLLKNLCPSNSSKTLTSKHFADYFRAINDPETRFFQADEDVLIYNERYLKGELGVMFQELDVEISLTEIRKAVQSLKNGKSSGPDLWINEFIKYGISNFLEYFYVLFNKIFDTGYFPDSWGDGFIVPLHKKGSAENVENYRGITLLSVIGKLFTNILNNRLNSWAEKYHIYVEAQSGFRKGMCTIDNVFILHSLISHCINDKTKLYSAFIDFKKAFDYVVRDVLWYKLIQNGVRGKILNIIQSMYNNIKSKVKFNNVLSDDFSSHLGVRQGECLSPFLFSMYLNDLENEFIQKGVEGVDIGMLKLFLLLYADDIVIFSNTMEGLQRGLDVLAEYCEKWKLTVNTDKTKIMVFRKGGNLPRNLSFNFQGKNIEIVKKFVYLGITFTAGGSFTETHKTLSGQALKAIFKLNQYLFNFTNLSPKHVLDLFDKLIVPILCYGGEVWGFSKPNQQERIHLQYCKKILAVKKCTQNDFVYGELGRVSLQTRLYYSIINYWFKILESPETRYIRFAYKMMLADMEKKPNIVNWASNVKNLLSNLGFYEVWLNQNVGNKNAFLKEIRVRLTDNFVQNWSSRITESSRANFYSLFSNFNHQLYLETVNVQKFRIALTKLRVSSHRLEIEVGRWSRPNRTPIGERKCFYCNKLEDEFHFLLECYLYKDLRKTYIHRYFWNRPNMIKLKELMTTENKKTLLNLAIFTEKAFKLRSDTYG